MRDPTYSDPFNVAIKRYDTAVEQMEKVAHYVDRAVMGRDPTESEMEEFRRRSRNVEVALQKVCACPCPDFTTLRRKARNLDRILKEKSLGQKGERALVQSILQMPRGNHADQ